MEGTMLKEVISEGDKKLLKNLQLKASHHNKDIADLKAQLREIKLCYDSAAKRAKKYKAKLRAIKEILI